MPSAKVNEATQAEWRELGFFYDRDDAAREWRIEGSKTGLLRFSKLFSGYAADSRNTVISEHEHYGPYMYLEIGTWHAPEITEHWIAGPVSALRALADVMEERISSGRPDATIALRDTFSPASPYELLLKIKDDDFDPAKADNACW